MAEPIVALEQHPLVVLAEALLVHLNTHVRLHDRRAERIFNLLQFHPALQGAEQALAVNFRRVPNRNGVDVVSHVLSSCGFLLRFLLLW